MLALVLAAAVHYLLAPRSAREWRRRGVAQSAALEPVAVLGVAIEHDESLKGLLRKRLGREPQEASAEVEISKWVAPLRLGVLFPFRRWCRPGGKRAAASESRSTKTDRKCDDQTTSIHPSIHWDSSLELPGSAAFVTESFFCGTSFFHCYHRHSFLFP